MDEETYRKEIISLEDKLHQVYGEYRKNRDLFNQLKALIDELKALSIESHNHLNSLIAKCENRTEINILIQKEYPAWLHDKIVIINRRFQHLFEESDTTYSSDDFNSIIDITDSIKL